MTLNEDSIIDFGKHKGSTLKAIPRTYLFWLAGYRVQGTSRTLNNSDAYNWVKENKKEYVEYAVRKLFRTCWFCEKALVPIGNRRQNGDPDKKDWDKRYLHVSCWKYLKEHEEMGVDRWVNY